MFSNLKLLLFMEAILIAGLYLFRFSQKGAARPLIKPLYIGTVLLIPVAGLFLRNFNIFYLFVFLVPFAARGDRKDLACLYLAMLPQFPELGQTYTIGPIYLGTVSAITFLNFGALIALFTVRGRARHTQTSLDVCAWGLFALLYFSQARGLEINGVLRQGQYLFLGFMPPYLVISRTLRSREEIEQAMLVFTWSIMLAASIAVFESIRGWPLYQTFYGTLNVPVGGQGLSATLAIRSGFLRAQGPVCNSTCLGVLLAAGVLLPAGLKHYFKKPQIWAIYGTLILGLIFTQSRGAWIGAGAGYVIRLAFQRRFGLATAVTTIAAIGWIATGVVTAEGGQISQMLGKSGDAEMTAQYRSNLLSRGIEEIQKHSIQGQTPAELQVSMDDMRQGEHIIDFVNSHLYIALVAGIEGLLFWLIFWNWPLIVAFRAQTRIRRTKLYLPIEIPASILAACFVALVFTSPIDRNPSLVAIALALIAALVRAPRESSVVSVGAARASQPIVAKHLAVQ